MRPLSTCPLSRYPFAKAFLIAAGVERIKVTARSRSGTGRPAGIVRSELILGWIVCRAGLAACPPGRVIGPPEQPPTA